MGNKTGIEWTDATWNPVRGCSRVSEGCRNCYAESVAYRFSGPGQPYEGLVQIALSEEGEEPRRLPQWNGQVRFVDKHLLDPLKWKPVRMECLSCRTDHLLKDCPEKLTRPRRIFVNSMSDLFHPNVRDEWIDRIFAVMALCPQHTFQVLTKRPERMLAYLTQKHANPQGWPREDYDVQTYIRLSMGGLLGGKKLANGCPDVAHFLKSGRGDRYAEANRRLFYEWPLSNVHLGVSVEDQQTADERIPLLLQTPAAVRFISAEPMLGAIDLAVAKALPVYPARHAVLLGEGESTQNPWYRDSSNWARSNTWLDWVIVGGESGRRARPMHPDWARSLRDQCQVACVPFFFKQWGEWTSQFPHDHAIPAGSVGPEKVIWMNADGRTAPCGDHQGLKLGADNLLMRVGKKAAGALLDGREWKEFPR